MRRMRRNDNCENSQVSRRFGRNDGELALQIAGCPDGGFGATVEREFAKDVTDVETNRSRRDVELFRDLTIRLPGNNAS